MKKTAIIAAALFGFMAVSYAQSQTPAETKQETAKTENAVFCPVSGEKVAVNETTPKAEYNGKTYYFCCNSCAEKFKKDPAKYAQKTQMKGKMCSSCSCGCCKDGKCDPSKCKCDCKDCKCRETGKYDCKNCSGMKGDKNHNCKKCAGMKGHKNHKGKKCNLCNEENAKPEINKQENKPQTEEKK